MRCASQQLFADAMGKAPALSAPTRRHVHKVRPSRSLFEKSLRRRSEASCMFAGSVLMLPGGQKRGMKDVIQRIEEP